MAGDVGASLPSAWQSQHYTNKSSAYHPTADCGTVSIRCLIFSQCLRSRIKGMMAFAPGTLQQGTAMWDLTGFPQSPPGPKLLRCLWRRLNSPCPAVRGRPFPGRGAALSPPQEQCWVLLQFRIPAEVWVPGDSPPHHTPAEWLTSCSSHPPWQGDGQEDHSGEHGSWP